MLIEGYWYSVTNPSNPPVDFPIEDGMYALDAIENVVRRAEGEAVRLLEEDAVVLTRILADGVWTGGTTDCSGDCVIGLGGRWFHYHSECGTFHKMAAPNYSGLSSALALPAEVKYLSLSDAERTGVNGILEKYVTLGPDMVENAG